MAEENQSSGEKSEAPSAKRRSDFRNKGQVAQSREVGSAALLTILLLFWIFYGSYFWQGLEDRLSFLWSNTASYAITVSSAQQLLFFLVKNFGILIAPLFALSLLIGFFATFIQIGWLFTFEPMVPKLSKLNPISGMARFVSKKSFVELFKSLCKVSLIAWIAFSTIRNEADKALQLIVMDNIETLHFIGHTAAWVMAKIVAIMIFLAALDYGFVRWEMEEKMKMTKQEVKEEMKDTDGDPFIKSKIRSIQQQMARNRMMASVPEADVVITNPTRISVAIKYDRETMEAPVVIAKGQGLIAKAIRELAEQHGIPLVENKPVARLLHAQVEIGQTIPEEVFKAVAEILAYVYSLKE